MIQGRHDTYPKRRGLTRIKELQAAGVATAFGHDCVMDPWYSLGSGDMLEVAHMAIHGAQLTAQDAMRQAFAAVTSVPAAILGLEGYGLDPGADANLVLLDACDPIEAIRLKASRLIVVRHGAIIARTEPRTTELAIADRPRHVTLHRPGREPEPAASRVTKKPGH